MIKFCFGKVADWVGRKQPHIETLVHEDEQARISRLKQSIQFKQILPNPDQENIFRQLVINERVHPIGKVEEPLNKQVEELLNKRIGQKDTNKLCFARVFGDGNKPLEVTTGVFVTLVKIPRGDKPPSPTDLSDNILEILNEPIQDFHVNPETEIAVATFYTISSSKKHSWDKGGRPLVKEAYDALQAEAKKKGYKLIIATLSPVPDFSEWLNKQSDYKDILGSSELRSDDFMENLKNLEIQNDIKQMLMRYLVEERDPVMNFHLGNGAYIGDIKFNLDNPKYWVMINYVYPSLETRGLHQDLYNRTRIRFFSPHLKPLLNCDQNLIAKTKSVLETPFSGTIPAIAQADTHEVSEPL